MSNETTANDARCSVCGRAFACGAITGAACWCAARAPLPAAALRPGGCLCPACLDRALAASAGVTA